MLVKKTIPKISANVIKLIRISFIIVRHVEKCNNRDNDDIDNDVVDDDDDENDNDEYDDDDGNDGDG